MLLQLSVGDVPGLYTVANPLVSETISWFYSFVAFDDVWFSCHRAMARPQVAGEKRNNFQTRRETADVLKNCVCGERLVPGVLHLGC